MSGRGKVEVFMANFAKDLYVGDSFWNTGKSPEIPFLDAPKEVQERFLYLASHLVGISDDELSSEDVKKLADVFDMVKAKHDRVNACVESSNPTSSAIYSGGFGHG